MKDEFERIIKKGTANKDLDAFGKEIDYLTTKFNVVMKTIYTRFKSCYGKSPREVILDSIYPSKQEFIDIVINSSTGTEVRKELGLSNRHFVGIYDRYLGCSTFKSAKLKLLGMQLNTQYVNVREDNRSLVYSQLLGDGSYNSSCHGLRIIHSEKQVGYLKWKVNMLNKAYPKTSTKVEVRTHKQGHMYGDYYTKLGNIDIPSEVECVELLTNRGWLLWWLDDGSYNQNVTIACKRSETIRNEAVRVLKTFGIEARCTGSIISMCGQENDLKFYNNFIKPFINEIPLCMRYKVDDIVELASINLLD